MFVAGAPTPTTTAIIQPTRPPCQEGQGGLLFAQNLLDCKFKNKVYSPVKKNPVTLATQGFRDFLNLLDYGLHWGVS